MIFTKPPIPGTVKTRLIPDIGEQAATALHKELLLHTLDMLEQAQICPVELWVASDYDDPFIMACQQRFSISIHRQVGEGLGERMHHALSQQQKGAAALLIGSDIPSITADYLRHALTMLHRGHEWVLGPAEDGGYVLVGCAESDIRFFDGVEWGSEQVLSQTLSNAEKMTCQPYMLEPLWDLDNYEDLQRWRILQQKD